MAKTLTTALKATGCAVRGEFMVIDAHEADTATGEQLVYLYLPMRCMKVTLTVARAYLKEWHVPLTGWVPAENR